MVRDGEAYQLSMPLQMPNQALHLTRAPLQPRDVPREARRRITWRVTIKARSR